MPALQTKPTDREIDRAIGVLAGSAAGDTLGARPPRVWNGNIAMALAIAEIAGEGADLCAEEHQDYIVQRWAWWARSAPDVDPVVAEILSAATETELTARSAREAAAALGRTRPSTNTSLARTAPVALANLHDEAGLVEAARRIGTLTHADPEAADACVLWCLAIRNAVLTGRLDARIGLGLIDSERAVLWGRRIAEAERSRPSDFAEVNAEPAGALQGAWSAIAATPVPADDPANGVFAADHLRLALEEAVRGGGDATAVATIAGGLLGAAHGVSALPWRWRTELRGWPGLDIRGLANLGSKTLHDGEPDRVNSCESWCDLPPPRRHPRDGGVRLGARGWLQKLPRGIDAVVSLCPVVDADVPVGLRDLEVRFIDQFGANQNLDFVLFDTVRAIEALRDESATVFLHGASADGRTATVAALYGARRAGIDVDQALAEVCGVLPGADPNPDFRAALRRLHPSGERKNR
ncbi:ADP-ribosylglycohydrolase family protein [Mycolicibacterium sp.]|uniref:ADP-ribosylglycohydrolase family protein n=1 Tax=Mycolicibacterium sp. TaxID=2320850 RepID=UPI001D3CF6F4|nr:ADP-ribosylglycohydrolase family protein [Mycolicibacterium sp.]MCB1290382.1 ADP-ribosylglycohydrolase family protein [Mycobacterium sp.]MCB9409478.1 ADP-ribosylglycohydrolase family protein [Mycolicibacterium sp.]